MIYLDCAATSFQKPGEVLRAYERTIRSASSPGRGSYAPAMRASDAMLAAREAAAAFFNFPDPERVVMTMNATHALNIAIHALAQPGRRAVISGFEHNSVVRPLIASGMELSVAGRRLFDDESLLRDFRILLKGASLAVSTHVSNVFGYVLPIGEITRLCRQEGVPLIVDASQSAGVIELDWHELDSAYVAMPGHKSLLGVPGSGLLLCGQKQGTPLLFGGSGSDSRQKTMPDYYPDRFEAGTQNAPAAAALSAGIRYITKRGRKEIERHEQELCSHMRQLLQNREELQLFCPEGEVQSGVLSFRCSTLDCEEIAARLGEAGICVRAGLHCAPLAHESAGTIATGTVRMSFSPFNTHGEVEAAAAKLIKII